MKINYIEVFFAFALFALLIRFVFSLIRREQNRESLISWFLICGLLGALSMSWWAPEIFVVDKEHDKEDNNKVYYLGSYDGKDVSLFHQYVDNKSIDTLVCFEQKYYESDDSLGLKIILPNKFVEVGGSIDYYKCPPPTSVKVPSIPFVTQYVRKWTLMDINLFLDWQDDPKKYGWSE